MEAPAERLYRASEFAKKAGVSVRTLHVYDQLGLLVPNTRTDSGYRLYGETELQRLEHILALRFVGLGLDQIKQLLDGPAQPLEHVLRVQRGIIAEEQRRLDLVLQAIDEAQVALSTGDDEERWRAVQNVIEAFKMKNDFSWTEKYYTPEDLKKLAEIRATTSPDIIEKGERDWAELIAEVEAACKTEAPTSDHAKSLARRWCDLVQQFTKGDAGIERGLRNLWTDSTHWPKDFKKPYSDEAEAFIRKAQASLG